jgi:4-carboxymuconolactone decarboxylase
MADDDLVMPEDAAMSEDADTPILDVLATMTEAAVERSTLDPAAQILLRFAALVALDAAPASYLFHFGVGADQGLTMEDAQQVLVTLAPVVGTARIVSASSKISQALGFALDMAILAAEEDAGLN